MLPRFARNSIIASMQPTHQTSDRLMAEKRLGPDRLKGAYAWQSVLKAGARIAFGSDFPVESPNPFPGLAAAQVDSHEELPVVPITDDELDRVDLYPYRHLIGEFPTASIMVAHAAYPNTRLQELDDRAHFHVVCNCYPFEI